MPVDPKPVIDKLPISLLELHLLSLLDRGAETPYDFLQAGLSLGSTIPALRRMEDAGWVRAKRSSEVGKRQRHSFSLTATGRKLVVRAGAGLLHQLPPADFDSVLRVIDIGLGIGVTAQEILPFIEAAKQDRLAQAKLTAARNVGHDDSLQFKETRNRWEAERLKAEARFLAQIIKSLT